MNQKSGFFILLCLSLFTAAAVGQTSVLEVDRDAYMCDCQPNANNPGGPITKLYQGPYYVSGHQCFARTASVWDLSSLPPGCRITRATMELKCTSTFGTLTGEMVFYRILQPWGETTITTNNLPLYTSQDSIIKSWPAAGQWFSIDVTSFVRFWQEHPDSNFGIYGHCTNTTANTGAVEFNSSRFTTSADRPRLMITYSTTDVKSEGALLPSDFHLDAYPNPFNPITTITYQLDHAGLVSLAIMDIKGRKVDQLVNSFQPTGVHRLQWHAGPCSSGIYFITLTSENKQAVKKLVLMK
ncbi:MAG: DNRLRE domain-containing protein [Ignavibacteriae bacterium]|nr:MAG: DNRLRE domain-containing protein [Ignavibacteriota bacterium]